MNEELDVVEYELKQLTVFFLTQKEVYPTFIVIKDDKRFVMPASFQNAAQKDIISQGMKDLVKKSDPDYVVYVSEAWIAPIRTKMERLTSVSKANDRKEILMIVIEFNSGTKHCRFAYVLREGNDVRLTKFEKLESDLTSGRFMDFFPTVKN